MGKLAVFGLLLLFVILAVYSIKVSTYQSKNTLQDTRTINETGNQLPPPPTSEILLDVVIPEKVSVPILAISGSTTPGADVFVNETETIAGLDGRFSLTYQLDEGENTVIIVANDENGLFAEKEVTVTYTPVQ